MPAAALSATPAPDLPRLRVDTAALMLVSFFCFSFFFFRHESQQQLVRRSAAAAPRVMSL